jgi:hypothetical protein
MESKTQKRNRMPRASLVISIFALIVAMSGAAVAAQGTLSSKQIKDNGIKSVDLKDGKAVFSQDVRDENLTGNDVAPDSLAAADLAPNSADSDEIADNGVTSGEIADNAVNSGEIADNAVNSGEIAANAVGTQDVADNTLSANDLGAASVAKPELAADAVGSSEFGPTLVRTNPQQIAANSSGGAVANCAATETRISGGAIVPAGNGHGLQSSWPNGANGWSNIIRNNTASDITVTAYVLCLQA